MCQDYDNYIFWIREGWRKIQGFYCCLNFDIFLLFVYYNRKKISILPWFIIIFIVMACFVNERSCGLFSIHPSDWRFKDRIKKWTTFQKQNSCGFLSILSDSEYIISHGTLCVRTIEYWNQKSYWLKNKINWAWIILHPPDSEYTVFIVMACLFQ